MNDLTLPEPDPKPKPKSPLLRRRGKFMIRADLVRENPERILLMMQHCIITRCELLWQFESFSYDALSPLFDEVEDHLHDPEYEALFNLEITAENPQGIASFIGFEKR